MKMAVVYGRKIGFKGDFYIEPKPKEPMKHQYDFDASTAIGFLRQYGLDKDFKLNIEANHATLAGHTFQHDLRISAINGMLGSIDANQGDYLLGWDTDEFPFDVYTATMCMYEVLKAGVYSVKWMIVLRLRDTKMFICLCLFPKVFYKRRRTMLRDSLLRLPGLPTVVKRS